MKTLSIILALAGVAEAQPADNKAQAQAQFELGLQEYQAKDYAKAAQHFESAYSLDHDPIYEFNEAQAFRQLGDCQRAIALYTQFRNDASKSLSAQDLDKVKRYINGEGCAQRDQATPTPNPPPNPPPPNPTPPNPTTDVKPTLEPAHPIDTGGGGHSNALAYGLGVAGLAAIAIGGYYTYQVYGPDSAARDTDQTKCNKGMQGACETLMNSDNVNGSHDQDVAITTYVIGGVAVVVSAIMVLHHRGSAEQTVTVAPTKGGAAVVAKWRF